MDQYERPLNGLYAGSGRLESGKDILLAARGPDAADQYRVEVR